MTNISLYMIWKKNKDWGITYGAAPSSDPYLEEDEADHRTFRTKVAEAECHDKLLDWIKDGSIK